MENNNIAANEDKSATSGQTLFKEFVAEIGKEYDIKQPEDIKTEKDFITFIKWMDGKGWYLLGYKGFQTPNPYTINKRFEENAECDHPHIDIQSDMARIHIINDDKLLDDQIFDTHEKRYEKYVNLLKEYQAKQYKGQLFVTEKEHVYVGQSAWGGYWISQNINVAIEYTQNFIEGKPKYTGVVTAIFVNKENGLDKICNLHNIAAKEVITMSSKDGVAGVVMHAVKSNFDKVPFFGLTGYTDSKPSVYNNTEAGVAGPNVETVLIGRDSLDYIVCFPVNLDKMTPETVFELYPTEKELKNEKMLGAEVNVQVKLDKSDKILYQWQVPNQ